MTLRAEIKQLLLDEKAKHEGTDALPLALVKAVERLADKIEEVEERLPVSGNCKP